MLILAADNTSVVRIVSIATTLVLVVVSIDMFLDMCIELQYISFRCILLSKPVLFADKIPTERFCFDVSDIEMVLSLIHI